MSNPVLMISEIRPYLFLSRYRRNIEEQKLRHLGITHCVDVTNLPKSNRIPGIEYQIIRIEDSIDENIKEHFQATAEFVQKAKELGGRVVIYCAAGVSRSATLTIMCLVINEGCSLKEAYQIVLKARPIIYPNIGFWRQMIEWESEQNGGSTTVQLLTRKNIPIPDVYLNRFLLPY